MAQKESIKEHVRIPDNVQISLTDRTLTVTGEKGTLTRVFTHPIILLAIKDKKIEISCTDKPKRKEKALVGTFQAHIKNMIRGVSNGFEYQMKTVFAHFPIKTSVEGNKFVIQNFLGERSPRKAVILEGVDVKTQGENVTVTGVDKEKVGQTVANIERATRVRNRDIRVFQDGVYLISKNR
jgi:large subunit ribosomal protein L6